MPHPPHSSFHPPSFLLHLLPCFLLSLLASPLPAAPPEFKEIPWGQPPIDYLGEAAADPVARLGEQLAAGRKKLQFEGEHGYLRSLLQELEIPVESQTLVFSKTSVNQKLISPRTPRALYFNDHTYVGWIPETDTLEICSLDPQKGILFYTVPQEKDKSARVVRAGNCLACHASSLTAQVPGLVLKSFMTDDDGQPVEGFTRITHETPYNQRWGGWYVSGLHGSLRHSGNIFGKARQAKKADPDFGGNVTNLQTYFPTSRYLMPGSDIVALLVLDHQCYVQNLLTRLNFETRLQQESQAELPLLEALFFVNEPALPEEVIGDSGLAEAFEFAGPSDLQGRSLRQFDLQTRLFKYRLSYLVYSKQFQELPEPARTRLVGQIQSVLAGTDPSPKFAILSASERTAIREILAQTQGLPAPATSP